MKSFCILEQGRHVNEPLTLKKKALFSTGFSDFYRLNWQNPDDPNAFIKDDFIKEKTIIWSEGRSLLYERVPKIYDYYIFVDDDMEFYSNGDDDNIAVQIKEFLAEYKPITGTFYDPDQWNFAQFGIDKEKCISQKVFPIAGYDQQIQFFSKSFADLMFPTIYHGGGACMWYSQWLCYKLFPLKQICFSGIQVE